MCEIPYDWELNEPDDWFDGVAWKAKVWDGTGYPPDADRILSPFEGHLATYDFSNTSNPYDNNTHLDLRCQPMMSKSPTDPIEFAEKIELDIEIPNLDEVRPSMSSGPAPEPKLFGRITPTETHGVPPSGYDENGTPLPPSIPFRTFEKAAVPVTVEFPVVAYPNPFNSSTKISCFIHEDLHGEDAVLEIYDSQGKLVCNSRKTIDDYNLFFKWNSKDNHGIDVPTGTYYYRITVDCMTVNGTVSLVR